MLREKSLLGKRPALSSLVLSFVEGSKGWHVLFFLTALLVAAADQLSKELWIRSHDEGQVIFQAGFFRIVHTNNTGAAFGILQDQPLFLTMVAIAGIILILFLALHLYRHIPLLDMPMMKLVLGLILGGTVGNLIDRLRFGQVADFISIGIWPAFNLADSAVTVGVILFAYLFITTTRAR